MSSQTEKDTARNKSKQNGGDGGTSERMSQREAAAGLNLAGNDTMSGRGQPMPTMSEREAAAGLNLSGNDTMSGRGKPMPTFAEREAAAGLNLAGNNTISGRDDFYNKRKKFNLAWSSFDSSEVLAGSEMEFKADVPSGGGGGGNSFFEIIQTDDNKFKVSFGVVNDTVEPPEVIGGSNETEFSTSGNLTFVYLKLTLDEGDQSVTTAEITTTSPTESTTIAKIQIGWLKLDGSVIGTIRNTLTKNPTLLSCGSFHYYIT